MISNKPLEQRLNKAGYYQCPTTPGLWRHKWRQILFCLIVDDFGIEYVDKHHAEHLRDILLEHYEITQVDAGKLGAGPVLDEFIVLEEDVAKVVSVAFSNVFDAQFINDQAEEGRAALVAPYARDGGTLILT